MVTAYNKAITRFVGEIESVTDERKGELHELLWASVMKGYDRAKFTNDLVECFGLGIRDAAAISRYQHSLARVVMENARRLEIGLTEAEWMHAGAPCDDAPHHETLNGKRYKIEAGVLVSGKQIWPGSEPGCKCSSKAIVPGFD
jgi:hypothetical protein